MLQYLYRTSSGEPQGLTFLALCPRVGGLLENGASGKDGVRIFNIATHEMETHGSATVVTPTDTQIRTFAPAY